MTNYSCIAKPLWINTHEHPVDIYLETLVLVKLDTKCDGLKGRFEVWCHKVLGSILLVNQVKVRRVLCVTKRPSC